MPQSERTSRLIEEARGLKMSPRSRRRNIVSQVIGLSGDLTREKVIELRPELAD